ncbi:cytochrome P450 [Skermania sp. ID1734]|uniref:cytochrome P450 n=1 Tax=Skermania sp. ID1734 TaxID=2597516 RepID=UPI00118157E6|nr:cytochrome P450 [Skermania sp. ID1734]TSE00381.1 cytochrome P450 [Skermania sp. ID1734]
MRSQLRWGAQHGLVRGYLRVRARRGDPFAQFMMGTLPPSQLPDLAADFRARGPLVRTPRAWVSVDYEVCRSVLRDNRFGTMAPEALNLPWPASALLRAADLQLPSPAEPPSMLMVDPPEHTRLRRSVSRAFTPRAIARLSERVRQVTNELLDELAARPAADLIADFAARLPVAIIAEMLGVPADVRPKLLGWGNAGAALLDAGISWPAYRAAIAGLREAERSITEHIADLRRAPGDDILSDLVTSGDLTDYELVATAMLLAGAGFETTVNLIGNGAVLLCRHRAQLDRLRDDPQLWPNAIEEMLRFDSPVQRTARTTCEPVELAGHALPPRRTVVLWLGQANRDPRVFDNPDEFDVGRKNAKDHLAFGSGVHACLGASLARMEGTFALQGLFERFPGLRLDGEPTPRSLITLHGYQRVPVQLGRLALHE